MPSITLVGLLCLIIPSTLFSQDGELSATFSNLKDKQTIPHPSCRKPLWNISGKLSGIFPNGAKLYPVVQGSDGYYQLQTPLNILPQQSFKGKIRVGQSDSKEKEEFSVYLCLISNQKEKDQHIPYQINKGIVFDNIADFKILGYIDIVLGSPCSGG